LNLNLEVQRWLKTPKDYNSYPDLHLESATWYALSVEQQKISLDLDAKNSIDQRRHKPDRCSPLSSRLEITSLPTPPRDRNLYNQARTASSLELIASRRCNSGIRRYLYESYCPWGGWLPFQVLQAGCSLTFESPTHNRMQRPIIWTLATRQKS